MFWLFRFFSLFPLWLLHGMGAVAGWLAYGLSPVYRRHFRRHLQQAGYNLSQVPGAVAAAGRMSLELPRLWLGRPVAVQWDGQALIDAAHAQGKGVVFLTPHLGCFEVTAQAYAAQYGAAWPITVLYRPARQRWLREVLERSRGRPGLLTAPTTLAGVKQMLKALKAGQAVGLLPDQVPPQGQGVWAPFFGRQAYTMTLSARLAQQSGAQVLLAWGERLSWGRGYVVHFRQLVQPLAGTPEQIATQINAEMERLIRECPQQYLWGYARYKAPRGGAMAAAAPSPAIHATTAPQPFETTNRLESSPAQYGPSSSGDLA